MNERERRNTEIYREVSIRRGRGVTIPRSLCFYSPAEVLKGLRTNHQVKQWLRFVSNHYVPPSREILLIYPCSADKPYYASRSYKQLFRTLSALGDDRDRIHLTTISEPFGLVPEEFYMKRTRWHDWITTWYDCPGLFEWWCSKYQTEYTEPEANECIRILAQYVALFLQKIRTRKCYRNIIAFVRAYSSNLQKTTSQTHRRILEQASEMSGVTLEIEPPKRLVSSIVAEAGRFAWDFYGVSHPTAQKHLLRKLRATLREGDKT